MTSRQVTSPCDVTSSSLSPLTDDSSELGVQLTVGRRLKHIAMKATFDQPRNKDSQAEVKPSEFYASELLGSFIVDQQLQQPSTTVLQAVEVPLSTLIVVESPVRHTVHYISADQLHVDDKHVSPSSTSNWSSKLSSSSSDSHSSSSSDVQVSMFQIADTDTDMADEPCRLVDVTSVDDRTVGDLSDLDELREADLLPLPQCSESPFYLGLTDDELRRILVEPDCGASVTAPAVDVGDLISATELSWPSPNANATSPSGQAGKSDVHDYCTPEVIELLGSVYDDWLRQDPDTASLFSPT